VHCIGAVLTAYGGWRLASGGDRALEGGRGGHAEDILFGAAAGVLSGALATPGPAIAVASTRAAWAAEPGTARANLAAIQLVLSAATLANYGVEGRLSEPSLWALCSVALPAAAIGHLAGRAVNAAIEQEAYATLLNYALLANGALLLTQ
jgi:uncharacterized membrane protein YfcA